MSTTCGPVPAVRVSSSRPPRPPPLRHRTARTQRCSPRSGRRAARSASTARPRRARRRPSGRRGGSRAVGRSRPRRPGSPGRTVGTRLTSARSPIRAAMRASSDGHRTPVTVVDMTRSTSAGSSPASASAPSTASAPRSTATSRNAVVGVGEPVEIDVALDRQRQVTGVHPRAAVEAAHQCMRVDIGDTQPGEQLGQFGLRVSMRWENPVHGRESGHPSHRVHGADARDPIPGAIFHFPARAPVARTGMSSNLTNVSYPRNASDPRTRDINQGNPCGTEGDRESTMRCDRCRRGFSTRLRAKEPCARHRR